MFIYSKIRLQRITIELIKKLHDVAGILESKNILIKSAPQELISNPTCKYRGYL